MRYNLNLYEPNAPEPYQIISRLEAEVLPRIGERVSIVSHDMKQENVWQMVRVTDIEHNIDAIGGRTKISDEGHIILTDLVKVRDIEVKAIKEKITPASKN